MKLSKDQIRELNTINAHYSQIESLSQKAGIRLENVNTFYHFGITDFVEPENESNFSRNLSRQQVFQRAQNSSKNA